MAAGLDPKTGIYTYADGSTYQNPFQYAPGVWSLNDAQNTAMLGDQGAAVNAQLGRTAQAATPWNDPVQPVWGGSSGGTAPVGGVTTGNNKPMQVPSQSGGGGTPTGATNGGATFGGSSGSGGIINSAITPWSVTKDQTVAGNVESILANDSPLMQQARTRALQQMAGRGLINSSLAESAAQSSMIDAANAMAQADAATKAKAAGYNVDQLNQQVTLDKQLANQMNQAQLSAETSRYATDVNANTQKLNNESAQLIARLNNEQQVTLQKLQNENQRLLQTNQQAAQAYNNSMQYIDVINRDPNLDSAAKTRAQAQIYYNLDTQLKTLSRVSGLDVSSNLSLANAPGFDDKGNYVGFDENGKTKKP